jgi:hypothetical protein
MPLLGRFSILYYGEVYMAYLMVEYVIARTEMLHKCEHLITQPIYLRLDKDPD